MKQNNILWLLRLFPSASKGFFLLCPLTKITRKDWQLIINHLFFKYALALWPFPWYQETWKQWPCQHLLPTLEI